MRFSDIPGHDEAKNRLRQMADTNKLPHAILLEGPAGIGKFALARAAAQYIHCQHRSNGESCGVCQSCIQHQTLNHIDTIFSFPVVKKKIDKPVSNDYLPEFREFIEKEPFMPFAGWLQELGNPATSPVIYVSESDFLISRLATTSKTSKQKIVLMWLPEKMNEACANKMLKLIEEPFDDTIFILTSNASNEILPTIYSRCQRISMKRLQDDVLANFLERTYSIDHRLAASVARVAEGSVNEGLKRLSQNEQTATFFERFKRMMRLAYQRKILDLRLLAFEIAGDSRESQLAFLDYCVRQLRENFIYNLGNSQLVYLSDEESAFSNNFARFINEKNVLKLKRVFEDAMIDIAANGNPKIIFFDVAVKVILLLKQ